MTRGGWLTGLSLVLLAHSVAAVELYVDPSGVDTPDCTMPSAPCRTIQHAVDVAAAGDVILAAAGTYTENVVIDAKDLSISGAGAAVTTLDADASGRGFDIDHSVVVLSGFSIINGDAGNDWGGAISIWGGTADLTLDDCVVADNVAGQTGGITIGGNSSATVNRSVIRDNRTAGIGTGQGGGFFVASTGSLVLNDSTVSGNQARDGGGLQSFGRVWVVSSSITGNRALLDGGGIDNNDYLVMVNSTVSGNTAQRDGGGIFASEDARTILKSVTLAANVAEEDGGGAFVDMDTLTFEIANTILAGNVAAGRGPDCVSDSLALRSRGYNLVQDTTSCRVSGDRTGNITDEDPLLGALANNGGPTETHELLTGSPAIDAGNPAGCTGLTPEPLSADQRGSPRPSDCGGGARCDMGSFEVYCTPSGPTLYESIDPALIVDPANAVGTADASPHDHTPRPDPEVYYQLDDGAGLPSLIRVVKNDVQIRFWF